MYCVILPSSINKGQGCRENENEAVGDAGWHEGLMGELMLGEREREREGRVNGRRADAVRLGFGMGRCYADGCL